MPKIIVDGKSIECRDGVPVLQAALEAGWDIPHYCYHPGLSIVASCRLCLMEMKMPDPRTKEMTWAPRLFPSCQTPVKEGLEVRFDSARVRENQQHCMEYFLLNHPLDCPVCDKAGECYLQDYSEKFGNSTSRMVEEKYKNPKKDIGPRTLLYQDRCVVCTRCVRFTQEIAGTSELTVVNRGSRAEIDVFPGVPLDNKLQGNVVDLCPVGCLLDKDFLFKQRVWFLKSAKSVCPGCKAGCTIRIEQNENRIHRIKPRFNEKVNQWWMCDEGRFGWKYVNSPERLRQPMLRRGAELSAARWEDLPSAIRFRFEETGKRDGGSGSAVVLSPMMSCEEAWLLASFARKTAPKTTLIVGFVPIVGQDEVFRSGFKIYAEKCPNRRGIEHIIERMGGPTQSFEDFVKCAGEGMYQFCYLNGGYALPPGGTTIGGATSMTAWARNELKKAADKIGFLIVHDIFPSGLEKSAEIVIPGASWAERDGSFMNVGGVLQGFERAIPPLEGVKRDGQFFCELAGEAGLYRATEVRERMVAAGLSEFATLHVPRQEPEYAH